MPPPTLLSSPLKATRAVVLDTAGWSVDMLDALRWPPSWSSGHDKMVGGAVSGKWHAAVLVTNSSSAANGVPVNNNNNVMIQVWYAVAATTTTGTAPAPAPYACMTHAALTTNNSDEANWLKLAWHVMSDSNLAYLYVLNATTGVLLVYKLTSPPFLAAATTGHYYRRTSSRGATTTTTATNATANAAAAAAMMMTIPLQHDAQLALQPDEIVTCWHSGHTDTPTLLVGTNLGRLWWITQQMVPLSLDMTVVVESSSLASTMLSSWMPSWKTTTTTTPHRPEPRRHYDTKDAIINVTFLTKSSGSSSHHHHNSSHSNDVHFATLHASGQLTIWAAHGPVAVRVTFTHHRTVWVHRLLEHQPAVPSPLVESKVLAMADASSAAAAASSDEIHVLVVTLHAADEFRLYWLTMDRHDLDRVHVTWLNRFGTPQALHVAGMLVTPVGVTYAALVQSVPGGNNNNNMHQRVWIVAATAGDDAPLVVSELNVPTWCIPALVPGTLALDQVSHGCRVWTTLGDAVRVEWQGAAAIAADSSTTTTATTSNAAAVTMLATHLTSHFWHVFQYHNVAVSLPPSLTTAQMADLEAAVLQVALKLKAPGPGKSVWDYHFALLNLLQEEGLYRSFSAWCKWKLLGMGQELAAYMALQQVTINNDWEKEQLQKVTSVNVALWLDKMEGSEADPAVADRTHAFVHWLCVALQAALDFRRERARVDYMLQDAARPPPSPASDDDEVPWTSTLALQSVMKRCVHLWTGDHQQATDAQTETLVRAALDSFADSYHANPTDDTSKRNYAIAKKQCVSLLRAVKTRGLDELAFDLSIRHHNFFHLCQIAYDHESLKDRSNFMLEPLFVELSAAIDLQSGMLFPHYVLQWHVDHGLIGHALQYGKLCPDILDDLTKVVPALQSKRWIHTLRMKDYDTTAALLVANVKEGETTTLEAKFALGMAKLANNVARAKGSRSTAPSHGSDPLQERANEIDGKREHVNVQLRLMRDGHANDGVLLSKEVLLQDALASLDRTELVEEKVDACFVALALCGALPAGPASTNNAARVWLRALATDADFWKLLLSQQPDFTSYAVRQQVVRDTVFGGLLQRAHEQNVAPHVVFDGSVSTLVFQKFGPEYAASLQRLCSTLTSS